MLDNRTKLDEIIEVDHILNDWEFDFIQDMDILSAYDLENLSEKRQEKLNEIYDKVYDSPY